MKKFLATLLTAVLVLGLTVPAVANEPGYNGNNANNGYNNGYYEYNGNNDYNGYNNYENGYNGIATTTNTTFGYIGEIVQENGYYIVEIMGENGAVKATVLVPTTNAVILDAATGYPANLHDHSGKQVHITYDPLNYNALVVALNVEYMIIPHLHTIEAIERNGDNLVLTVDNGGLLVTLNNETQLLPWLTRQIVVLDEFQVGDKVLLWYSVVAMSYPAQTTTSRALRLMPVNKNGITPTDGSYGNDTTQTRELTGGIVRIGVNLYPVRENAEARGYNVYWNAELSRAELTRGDSHVMISLASKFAVYYVNDVQFTMPAPSLLENGRLYAPANFFNSL